MNKMKIMRLMKIYDDNDQLFEEFNVDPDSNSTSDMYADPFFLDDVFGVQSNILFLCSIFLAGAVVRNATDVLHIPVPYTVIVFFFGVLVGYLPLSEIIHLGPHTILYVFMPVLIFEGAFAIDVYVFRQIIFQVLILAGPGLVVMVFLTAGMSIYLFKYPTWNWVIASLFASILTATDPVAVVAIMKELGTSKRLALLIEGESMLNDGTAMVCFEIFMHMAESPDITVKDALLRVVWISVGGPVFGYLMAKAAIFWLQWTFNDTLTEIAITLSVAYLVFYIADAYLKVSAVLGVVTLGVTLSEHRTSISPEVEMFLHSFWETLAFMANTLIFHFCGFIISRFVITNASLEDWIYLIILYMGLNVIRGVTIMLFSPVLQRLGYGLSWQDGLVCSWSGLRGAIGLALSLIVFKSHISKLNTPDVGGKIVFYVSAVVVLSLLINGTTVSNLLTALGLTDVTPARRNAMTRAIKILDENKIKSMHVWKIDRFLADAEWEMINRVCTIEDPFMSTETTQEKELRERQGGICPQCHIVVPYVPTQSEVLNMLAESTRKYLKLLKQNFWMQFERGLLTGNNVRKLIELAEEAADKDCEMIHVREITGMWQMPKNLILIRDVLSSQTVAFPEESKDKSVCYMTMILLGESELLLFAVFGTDTIMILLTMSMIAGGSVYYPGANMINGIHNTNILLTVVSTLYFIFRVFMFRGIYLRTIWFYLNLICLIFGHLQFVFIWLDIAVWYSESRPILELNSLTNLGMIGSLIVIVTILRIMQICEFASDIVLDMIAQNVRGRLTRGCDLARGFVRTNEVAMRLIDNISDDLYVQSKIKNKAEQGTLSVLRELGLLQGIHPDVAIGVKTSQAIRSVLNVLREGMHRLIEEGGIDEPEGMLFVKVIESKMKRVMANPPRLLIPSARKILESIPWVDGNHNLVDYIFNLAERRTYQYGETVMKIGDVVDGIHVIISGLVKVEVPIDSSKPEGRVQSLHLLDFLSTGNVIGERSVLMDMPRSATLTCETIVETMFISTENLKLTCHIFSHLDPPLKTRIWKVTAIKLALNILSNMPSYRGMRQDTLLSRLENAELEYMDLVKKFVISSNMVDVILILGKAKDANTKDVYIGPCYIPKNVMELVFPADQVPIPLILYTEKVMLPAAAQGAKLSLCLSDKPKSIYNLGYSGLQIGGLEKLNF